MSEPLIKVKNLKKYFPVKGKESKKIFVQAVDDISFCINKGETLGLVGESGCGKSTTGRALLNLIKPDSGVVEFEGCDILKLKHKQMRVIRKNMQIIFQDPYASLNPRLKVQQILAEPLKFHGVKNREEQKQRVAKMLSTVGFDTNAGNKYPHEFSGGQQQRIGIARALMLNPKFIVCDEAVSALDVSIQSQVLNLLSDLKDQFDLTFLFISHDLSVVKHISDRICVMYLGEIVEIAPANKIMFSPKHPYTRSLISAAPIVNPEEKVERIILEGDVPSPINPPKGCRFAGRCFEKTAACTVRPKLIEVEPGHFVACTKLVNS